jgi:hypothetical protein
VKDVLIDVTKVLRTYQWGLACGFAKDILGEARFENCVGYYPQENQDGYESYSQYALENSVAVNCYSISGGWYQEGVSEGYTWLKIVSKSFVEGMTAKPFGTTVAEVGFVGLDDTMWDLSGEKAVFKSSLDF